MMNYDDITDVRVKGARDFESLRTWGVVSYILHLVVAIAAVIPGGQVSVLLLVVALVMDLVKRDDAIGTWHASHFSWRLRSVIGAGVLYLITFPLFFLFYYPGAIAWALVSVWFLYRIVKGMARMNAGRAMYD